MVVLYPLISQFSVTKSQKLFFHKKNSHRPKARGCLKGNFVRKSGLLALTHFGDSLIGSHQNGIPDRVQ